MKKLAREITTIMVNEYGGSDFLRRISDPFWFQALGCVLGYDWHSSGVTTVVTGVLKDSILPEEHGIAVCGGKGGASRKTPSEILTVGERFGFSGKTTIALQHASKMSAKVDNAAIQAGYQLYHHAFFVADNGKWAVVQQGMCVHDRTARRYHWLSEKAHSLVVEPHNAIVGDAKREVVLDMTASQSEGCRKASVDLATDKPEKLGRMLTPALPNHQKSLQHWLPVTKVGVEVLSMPHNINWRALKAVYEFQPSNYEELLGFKGVGPATIRGLALIAELVYGEKPSWKDPVKYSFAYGGKDGVPYPVHRKAMDESVEILRQIVQEARISDKERNNSLQRLRRFVPTSL